MRAGSVVMVYSPRRQSVTFEAPVREACPPAPGADARGWTPAHAPSRSVPRAVRRRRLGRVGRRRFLLAQEVTLLALDLERLGVQHLELDAPVLRAPRLLRVGRDRRREAVALRRELR